MSNDIAKHLDSLDALSNNLMDDDTARELSTLAEKDIDRVSERFFKALVVMSVLAASSARHYKAASIGDKTLIAITMQQLVHATGKKAFDFLVEKGLMEYAED